MMNRRAGRLIRETFKSNLAFCDRSIRAMEDIVEFTDNTVHGRGHYRETYRKVGEEWRFASVHLTRLRVVTTYRC
jgi:hypothetical protein